MKLTTVVLLLFSVRWGYCTSPDDSLPSYMRGMNWNKVQEHLKENLRLSDDVVPTNYVIELSVNVRGHAGAEKSDFHGTVTIYLDIIKPVDQIELHSKELILGKPQMYERLAMRTPLGVSRISFNVDRETITVHLNRTIQTDEKFMIQIPYRGLARMDEYGLYENWDPKFNKSIDTNGPFVLASRNFPSGARSWFPCFDEPNKKATFELQINHPSGLNAYSNMEIARTENLGRGRMRTFFTKTGSLPTYQIALSVNHLTSQELSVEGFGKVRLISSNNSHDAAFSTKMDKQMDITAFFKKHLESRNAIGNVPQDKLDIIILEGTDSISVQPGLITVGRYSLWYSENYEIAFSLRNLTQIVTGSLISVRATNQMWLNDMFSFILLNETAQTPPPKYADAKIVQDQIIHSSLHERPLRDIITLSSSTKHYLTSRDQIPALKASHIMKLLFRFCPSSKESVKTYIADHIGGFASIDDLIETVSKSCKEPDVAREFLESFIDQPGKAFLSVTRLNDTVTIRQTRYHSTYFDRKLRDMKTRFTIPIFYTVDGKADVRVIHKNETTVKIVVPESSLFLIEDTYDHLYLAFYENLITPRKNISEEARQSLINTLQKSVVAAISIGYAPFSQIHKQLTSYVDNGILDHNDHEAVYLRTYHLIEPREVDAPYREETDQYHTYPGQCDKWFDTQPSWDGFFNNDTKYWENIADRYDMAEHIHCISEWQNSTFYQSFLEKNFMVENTAIRPNQMSQLARRSKLWFLQWRDLHRFFFRSAANFSNHRFDLLAETVLNQVDVHSFHTSYAYPGLRLREDYLNELRSFVIRNPRRAAKMSTEIEMRLEREFIRVQLPKLHNAADVDKMMTEFWHLEQERKNRTKT